jgi:hypothetical protein
VATATASVILLVLVLAGLIVRRRLDACRAFAYYLVAVLMSEGLDVVTWGRFYQPVPHVTRELLFHALKIAMMFSIADDATRGCLAARRALVRLLGVVAAIGLAAFAHAMSPLTYVAIAGQGLACLAAMGTWMNMTCIVVLTHFRMALSPLNCSVLVGLCAYQASYVVSHYAWFLSRTTRPELRPSLSVINTFGAFLWLTIVAAWAFNAWRPRAHAVPSGERSSRAVEDWKWRSLSRGFGRP